MTLHEIVALVAGTKGDFDPALDAHLVDCVSRSAVDELDALFHELVSPLPSGRLSVADGFANWTTIAFARRVSRALALVPGPNAVRRLLSHRTWDQNDSRILGARLAQAQTLETLEAALVGGGPRLLIVSWMLEAAMRERGAERSAEVSAVWRAFLASTTDDYDAERACPLRLEQAERRLTSLLFTFDVGGQRPGPAFSARPLRPLAESPSPGAIGPLTRSERSDLAAQRMARDAVGMLLAEHGTASCGVHELHVDPALLSARDFDFNPRLKPPRRGTWVAAEDIVPHLFSCITHWPKPPSNHVEPRTSIRELLLSMCDATGSIDHALRERDAIVFHDDDYHVAFALVAPDRRSVAWAAICTEASYLRRTT